MSGLGKGDLRMVYIIFEVRKEDIGKINRMISDDLVSRQSIITRDSQSLDLENEATYVKIEGSEDGVKRAEEIAKELGFKKLNEKEMKRVNDRIEAQEDSAASGIGMIFD